MRYGPKRESLRKHIREFLDRPECSDEVRNNAVDVSWCVMEALDSWIEENSEEGEIKIGDKVRLKRKLSSGDGSMTDKVCDVVSYMERIPAGDVGEVVEEHSDGEVRVYFDCISSNWNFHIDDLEKVHT